MTTHTQRKWVRHSADQMLELVMDVGQYPEFIPWCAEAVIHKHERLGNREEMLADLSVAFKMFRETFRSRVDADRDARRIDIEYLEGPFRYLINRWVFEENEDGTCTIDFFIDFEFRSKALQLLISAVFGEAVRRMVGAFETRADAVYGDAGAVTLS